MKNKKKKSSDFPPDDRPMVEKKRLKCAVQYYTSVNVKKPTECYFFFVGVVLVMAIINLKLMIKV